MHPDPTPPRLRLASPLLGLLCAAAVPVGVARAGTTEGSPATPSPVPATASELRKVVRQQGRPAVLVNVWATWCLPCREEMPDLLRLRREYRDRGLSLVLVSGDFEGEEESAREFLAEQGVDFVTYLKKGEDQDFIDAMSPEWSGALPATFVYGPRGELLRFHEGKASYTQFEEMIREALDSVSGEEEEEEP